VTFFQDFCIAFFYQVVINCGVEQRCIAVGKLQKSTVMYPSCDMTPRTNGLVAVAQRG